MNGKYEIDHARIAGKLENAVGYRNAGHALWTIVYADGTESRFGVIALSTELDALGLREMAEAPYGATERRTNGKAN